MTERQTEVILTLADCNMNTYETARRLYLHRTCVSYHISRIKEITGLNPLNFYDLIKLVEKSKTNEVTPIKNPSFEGMVDIKGYEGRYQIDRQGKVYSFYKNRLLNPYVTML